MRDIDRAIREIRQGNHPLREELIGSQKTFIYRYTSFICKRKLDWANDDELSLALIAYNKAIDTFDSDRGYSFSNYARVLIKNSLIDHFRKQHSDRMISLETLEAGNKPVRMDEEASLQRYTRELEEQDRNFELNLFKDELAAFGIRLRELPKFSPSHHEAREYLKSAAQKIASNGELIKGIYRDKKLPLKEIQLLTGVNRKKLDKWRRYLLALIIILTNPDLEILSDYIWGKEGGR